MRGKIYLSILLVSGVMAVMLTSCKKDSDSDNDNNNDPPVVPETITDVDGNVYRTISVGTQVWMAENLKTTKYRNGDPIPKVNVWTLWDDLTTGAYCDYDSSGANATVYGHLYNWHAVNDARNIAPQGWHVATSAEWAILIDYLGGASLAGGKLKETGTTHWSDPNTGATDQIGFTALPGGLRYGTGAFFGKGNLGLFWTATEYDATYSRYQHLGYDISDIYSYNGYKRDGYAVRCVKD